MFWSDPNLYGATLPYRDPNIPVQTPFMGPVMPQWQNLPRFVPPPIYNINPFLNVHPMAMHPYLQTWGDPFQRRFDAPHMRQFDYPYTRPFDVPMYNLYNYNPYRPFVF